MKNNINYKFLEKGDLSKIHNTFHRAFADYQVDVSYMTEEVMGYRFIKNNVQYNLSVGAYSNDELIGITMIGVDDFKNTLTAFDVMTGIAKEYRGMGVAKSMFEFALPKIKKEKIEKFVLEVLRPNEKAIKAYSKSGFKIVRELDCFELFLKDIKPKNLDKKIKIEDVDKDRLNEFISEIEWIPSWENSFSGIERIENKVISIGAFEENKLVGILIYYPTLNWLMQLIVKKEHRRKGIGNSLLSSLIKKLPPERESFYCHNIESNQEDSHKFLKANGFKEIIGQYEMELTI